jgi:methionyl-tRNA formyltransferase
MNVLFMGARWLGMECLKALRERSDINLIGAIVPPSSQKVWWSDVVDEDVVNGLGVPLLDWAETKERDDIDLVISVLNEKIYRQDFIERIPLGILNLHPAPLPFYRGCNSYAHALMEGDSRYGVTVHYVDSGIDTGPIVEVRWFDIGSQTTGKQLYDQSQPVARQLFLDRLPEIIEAGLEGRRVPSKSQREEQARYFTRTSLEQKQVAPDWPRQKIYDFVRALDFPPFEPAFLESGEHKVYLKIYGDEITVLVQ